MGLHRTCGQTNLIELADPHGVPTGSWQVPMRFSAPYEGHEAVTMATNDALVLTKDQRDKVAALKASWCCSPMPTGR